MVWWIDKYTPNPNVCRSGSLCFFKSQDPNEEDRVFPSTSIMFTFNRRKYNAHDIHSLIQSGINIFNIDRTVSDKQFYKETISNLAKAQKIPEMYPTKFYMPITLAVTFSMDEPIDVEDEVDVVIIKNVLNLDKYLKFKKQYIYVWKKPVLLWLNKWDNPEVEQLIMFSDGVVLEHQRDSLLSEEYCDCALRLSKKFHKPVFYIKPDVLKDYYNLVDRDRRIIAIMSDIVSNQVDGIVMCDSDKAEYPPKDIIRSIVRAISFAEGNISSEKNYLDLSFQIRIPALPSISLALAASIAALKSEAKAMFVFTKSGTSARWCAYSSPPCPVIAITKVKATARRLHLYRKVIPLFYDGKGIFLVPRSGNWQQEWRNRVRFGTTFALKTGLFNSGAKLVVIYPSEGIGYCNCFQILTVPFKCDDVSFSFDREV